MIEIIATRCCGLREINNIQHTRYNDNPEQILRDAIPSLTGQMDGAFAFFTCNNDSTIGQQLSTAITNNNLGSVISTGYHHNPNSDNDVCTYVWTMDLNAMRQWLNERLNEDRLAEEERLRQQNSLTVRYGERAGIGGRIVHDVFGHGTVRSIRGEEYTTRLGVEFDNVDNGHNLNGEITSNNGKWISPARCSIEIENNA